MVLLSWICSQDSEGLVVDTGLTANYVRSMNSCIVK